MTTQRKYWVVSPNVINQEKILIGWKKEILCTHAAMMGWSPSNYRHGRIIMLDLGLATQSKALFQGEMDSTPSGNIQLSLPSRITVKGIGSWIELLTSTPG